MAVSTRSRSTPGSPSTITSFALCVPPKTVLTQSASRWRPRRYWEDEAQCQGQPPELWVGADGKHHTQRLVDQAKAVCSVCPVRPECLWKALITKERRGVLGGLTEHERFALAGTEPNPVAAMLGFLARTATLEGADDGQ